MKKIIFIYLMVISMPVFLGLLVWQSNRYQNLKREVLRLEQTQEEWVESNKRLVANIAEYSSPQRIEQIARYQLDLRKISPENLVQVNIIQGQGNGF